MSVGPIMIVAGGTGGHVFPGLAVASALEQRACAVVWMGTRQGLEARLVPQAGIEVEWITVSGLRGRGLAAWLAAPLRLAIALYQALAAMRRRRPAAVLGMGGFVSGPGGVAAWLTRRPLLIHEQNATAGAANRVLARLTRNVYEAFPGSFPGGRQATLIGNPVRNAIRCLPPPALRFAERAGLLARRVRILVLGGSQGARTLNREVPAALDRLDTSGRLDVWHQAGRGVAEAHAAYASLDCELKVEEFIDDMAAAYGWADLVICRAGALTIAELAAAGVGAVLIPYPYAADDHQAKNAASFAANGAGIVIPEHELSAARLAAALSGLVGDATELLRLAELARAQARPQAAETLADACVRLAGAHA
jgi:UDP-N-acetylglucosamine--N-acetylmuramyl-(pentapeptide) pyrophosphoryl-undecaprenol N-acetylglucosamine transferase